MSATSCGPDTEYHYGRYEAAYERYAAHWQSYQTQLAVAERKAVTTGQAQWETARLITQVTDALGQHENHPQPDEQLTNKIREIKHTTQQIAFNFDIPEKSGELPSEGLLGLIAVEGMLALDLASAGALNLQPIDPTGGFISLIVAISTQVAKVALEELLKEIQHRSEIANRVDSLVAELAQESQSLIDKTAKISRIIDQLDQDRIRAELALQELREAEWTLQHDAGSSPQSLNTALEEAVSVIYKKPLAERTGQNQGTE